MGRGEGGGMERGEGVDPTRLSVTSLLCGSVARY